MHKMTPSRRFPISKSSDRASAPILSLLLVAAVFFAAEASSAHEFSAVSESEKFSGEVNLNSGSEQISLLAAKEETSPPFRREVRWKYKAQAHKPALNWETGAGKSYLVPAVEIPAFVLVANAFGRLALPDLDENGGKAYETNPSTFWKNLVHGTWVVDNDDFRTNQLKHPYQGAMYQGLARSAGLGYWESSVYTFLGSFLWETAGETLRPSINDQIASGIAGNFLGEPLFRIASLLLERYPGFWSEVGAAVISPPTAVNRLVFGDRFAAVFPSHDPAVFAQGRLGFTRRVYAAGGDASEFEPNGAAIDFLIAYGLPGKEGYHYTRPFDYFQFEFLGLSTAGSLVESLIARGLLLGREYEVGEAYRGVWGLFGSYDFISPGFFRVSSTALSLGTIGQWWLSPSVALQSSAFAGLGYGAGGSVSGPGQRDYHYGATWQGLLALRLILGNAAQFDATMREYYVTDTLSTTPQGSETITLLNFGFTLRIFGRHALGLQYLFSIRQGEYTDLANQHQRSATLTFFYTLLSDTRFGAVEWRETGTR
jgi:hypothetical protein